MYTLIARKEHNLGNSTETALFCYWRVLAPVYFYEKCREGKNMLLRSKHGDALHWNFPVRHAMTHVHNSNTYINLSKQVERRLKNGVRADGNELLVVKYEMIYNAVDAMGNTYAL